MPRLPFKSHTYHTKDKRWGQVFPSHRSKALSQVSLRTYRWILAFIFLQIAHQENCQQRDSNLDLDLAKRTIIFVGIFFFLSVKRRFIYYNFDKVKKKFMLSFSSSLLVSFIKKTLHCFMIFKDHQYFLRVKYLVVIRVSWYHIFVVVVVKISW